MTRSGLAAGRSILLIATTIGTLADRMCAIASRVVGITPSSAATPDRNIGRLGAPCPHGGKGLVTRGIEEGDLSTLCFDLIGANVLGDTAGFALGNIRRPNGVEQLRLSVVDVAHDGNHRRPRDRIRIGLPSARRLSKSALACWRTSGIVSLVSQLSASATLAAVS